MSILKSPNEKEKDVGRYQITCRTMVEVSQPTKHRHIAAVGVLTEGGGTNQHTIQRIRERIDSGDEFYTKSPTTGKQAKVEKYPCHVCKTYRSIRTVGDIVTDNNLDILRDCT